jgi:hypothetical protein
MGVLAGLALGLALAALIEYRDTTLRTDDDVAVTIALPLLAMIPMMVTSAEQRQRLRARWLVVASAATVVVLGTAAVLWKVVGR